MKKKLLFIFLGMLMTFTAFARDFNYTYEGQTLTYTIIDEEARTCQTKAGYYYYANYPGNEVSGNLIIPEIAKDGDAEYSVTSIGSYAFSMCRGLTELTIPNSVSSIGNNAFNLCDSLTEVTIPNSVTSIGSSAFYSCVLLTSVTIGNTVTSIGEDAFFGCYNIEKLTIDCDNIDNWFNNKSSIKTLNIGNNVKSIGRSAFTGCSGLTSVTIPNSVTSIDSYAFNGCSSIKELIIEDGEETLFLGYNSYNKGLFYDCPLETLYLGRNLSYESGSDYGYSPFYNQWKLTNLTIGNAVTSIGYAAFSGCRRLTSVTIPNSVTEIGNYAFSGCDGLTSVTIPNSVTEIGDYVFYKCIGLTSVTIPNSVTSIGNVAFDGCISLTSVTIPNSVTEIGNYAFCVCRGLTSVTIPNSITSIGDYVFYGCSVLSSVTIPNSVTSIGNAAFEGCSGLVEITIPISVSTIGESAFRDCSSLTYVSIPDPVTQLYSSTFSGCSGLKEIVLPGSMREIADDTFSACKALERVTVINPIPPVIESSTFADCPPTAILCIPDGSRNLYWIHPYWGKFKTINNINLSEEFSVEGLAFRITSEQDSTVEVSGESLAARASRAGDGKLVIPSEVHFNGKTYRVTGIANNGFADFPISSVYLPETLSYVGIEAFKNCGLTAVTCLAALPPSANVNSFDNDTYLNAKLAVPESAIDSYKQNEVWQKFVNTAYTVLVQSLTLAPEVYVAKAITQFQITASVLPENATDKTLEWSSSDESVATVNQTGLVTILKEGECVITARTSDGSASQAQCRLSVHLTTDVDIVTSGADCQETKVFNLSGVMISDSTENLAPGIYIVDRGTETRKVIVK